MQNYYGEISGIDRAMGTLRGALQVMGLAENTIVWYTSDNGAQTSGKRPGSNGGLAGRKGTLWEGGIRVPTIIEWPLKIKQPRTSNLLSGTVDILPTLVDLAGVAQPDNSPPLDGRSLRGLIEAKPQPLGRTMGFWDYPARGRSVKSTDLLKQLAAEQKAGEERDSKALYPNEGTIEKASVPDPSRGPAAWMDGPYKLLRQINQQGAATYKLFQLDKDRNEESDLAATEPARVERMKKALAEWQQSVVRSYRGEDY